MYIVKDQARQGDLLITRVDSLPQDVKRVEKDKTRHVLSHSETGHPHIIEAPPDVVQIFGSSNPQRNYISISARSVELRHEKIGPEQHEPFELPPGIYEVYRQREEWPEGWEPVVD